MQHRSIPREHQIKGPHKATCVFPGPKNAFCGSFVLSIPRDIKSRDPHKAQCSFPGPRLHFAVPLSILQVPQIKGAPQSKMHFSRAPKCILWFLCPSPKALKLKGPTKQNAFSQAPKTDFAFPCPSTQAIKLRGPTQQNEFFQALKCSSDFKMRFARPRNSRKCTFDGSTNMHLFSFAKHILKISRSKI